MATKWGMERDAPTIIYLFMSGERVRVKISFGGLEDVSLYQKKNNASTEQSPGFA